MLKKFLSLVYAQGQKALCTIYRKRNHSCPIIITCSSAQESPKWKAFLLETVGSQESAEKLRKCLATYFMHGPSVCSARCMRRKPFVIC